MCRPVPECGFMVLVVQEFAVPLQAFAVSGSSTPLEAFAFHYNRFTESFGQVLVKL